MIQQTQSFINDILKTDKDQYENLDKVHKILEENHSKVGAPVRILQQVQELYSYLPLPVVDLIAKETHIPVSTLYGIITFYHFFTTTPRGKHVIQVCKGTACYVKGGQKILDALKRDYDLEPGGITSDKKFSLDMVRCLGCCGLAPVIAIDDTIYKKVKPSNLHNILNSFK